MQTQNIAVIRSFREALSGGQSYFPCRVYFVSTEEFEIPWGTVDPIGYACPLLGAGTQLRGGGIYVIRIVDTETFVKKVLRDNNSYTTDNLKEKLFERVYQEIADIISSVLENNGINSMECSKKKKEIAQLCLPDIQKLLDAYGIMPVDFTVSLEVDEEQRQMYEQTIRLQRMSAQGEAQARIIGANSKVEEMQTMGNAYTTIKGMDMLQAIAENPGAGGVAGMGAGIGMGMAAGSTFANITQTVFSGNQNPQTTAAVTQPDPMESLQKMKQMLDAGLIPQNVYDQKVAEILNRL